MPLVVLHYIKIYVDDRTWLVDMKLRWKYGDR
jgi:hypothetical protein